MSQSASVAVTDTGSRRQRRRRRRRRRRRQSLGPTSRRWRCSYKDIKERIKSCNINKHLSIVPLLSLKVTLLYQRNSSMCQNIRK